MPRYDRRPHPRRPQPSPLLLALLGRIAKALETIALATAHPPGSDPDTQKLIDKYAATLKLANDKLERRVTTGGSSA